MNWESGTWVGIQARCIGDSAMRTGHVMVLYHDLGFKPSLELKPEKPIKVGDAMTITHLVQNSNLNWEVRTCHVMIVP